MTGGGLVRPHGDPYGLSREDLAINRLALYYTRERRSTFQHVLTIIFGAPERVEIEANEQATYMYRKLMGSS